MSIHTLHMAVLAEHRLHVAAARTDRPQAAHRRVGTRRGGRLALAALIALLLLGGASRVFADPIIAPDADLTASSEQTLTAYQQAVDHGQPIAGFFAEDAVLTMTDTGEQFRGPAAIERAVGQFLHGAFVGVMTVDQHIVVSDEAAVAGEFMCAHVGAFRVLPATGRSVRAPYAAIFTLNADGAITTLRLHLSTQAILRQLAAPSSSDVAPLIVRGRPS